jgi:hypothetical protein
MVRWAGEAERVPLLLLRAGLPDATVRASIPDKLPKFLPLVVIRRVAGSSPVPRFWDGVTLNVQCWSDADPVDELDPRAAAATLADHTRRVLWEAWSAQTVTAAGHIVQLRESQGPMEVIDPDLPHLGRFIATYQLRVRPAS